MLISFAVVLTILFAFGGFFVSVLRLVKMVEAVFLSNKDEIDRDFFTDLQDRLAELADKGKAYALFLGIGCAFVMFPFDAFLTDDGRGSMFALLLMCFKMIPLFMLWNFTFHWFVMRFSEESFAQAEKLKGLSKVRGRVIAVKKDSRMPLTIVVDTDQGMMTLIVLTEIEEKFDWDVVVGCRVTAYYPRELPVVLLYLIVIDPIREEPECWQGMSPAIYTPHGGEWN